MSKLDEPELVDPNKLDSKEQEALRAFTEQALANRPTALLPAVMPSTGEVLLGLAPFGALSVTAKQWDALVALVEKCRTAAKRHPQYKEHPQSARTSSGETIH